MLSVGKNSSKCWEKGRSPKVRMPSQGTASSRDLYVILWQELEIRGDEGQWWPKTFAGSREALVPHRPSPRLLWWKAKTTSVTSSSPTWSSDKSPGHTAHQKQCSLFWILPSVQGSKVRWFLLSEVCIVESVDSFFGFYYSHIIWWPFSDYTTWNLWLSFNISREDTVFKNSVIRGQK